jgi:hypothetical protein
MCNIHPQKPHWHTTRILYLRALLLPRLAIAIPQQAPQNLPAWTLGDNINKLHPARQPLMAGFVLLHELHDIAAHERVRVLDADGRSLHDVRFRDFASALVGGGDYGAIGYRGVVEKEGFELCGGDLKALFGVSWVNVSVEGVEWSGVGVGKVGDGCLPGLP